MTGNATEILSTEKEAQTIRAPHANRKVRAAASGTEEPRRFFLSKSGGNGATPELGKELPGEAEAMVESLKTGLNYFVISEWRGVADFSGKKPQLGREAARQAPKVG